MELNLHKKRVLVTGGSKNIGRAIVKAFLAEGADVVFTYCSDKNAADEAYASLKPLAKGFFAARRADAMEESEVNAVIDYCYSQMGGLDVLVNNACPSGRTKVLLEDMTAEHWNRELFGAITPMYLHTRRLCQDCITNGKTCHIINISAAEGVKICSVPGTAPYAAGKAGVIMYTRTLAHQMAPYGIVVNGIIPGRVLAQELADSQEYAHVTQETRVGSLKDLTDPEEIAAMAVYLSSGYAAHMIGANVDVSGGLLL